MLRDQHRALFTYESQSECSPVAPRNSKDAEASPWYRGQKPLADSLFRFWRVVFYGGTCVR